jgi:hypothetical protein
MPHFVELCTQIKVMAVEAADLVGFLALIALVLGQTLHHLFRLVWGHRR